MTPGEIFVKDAMYPAEECSEEKGIIRIEMADGEQFPKLIVEHGIRVHGRQMVTILWAGE